MTVEHELVIGRAVSGDGRLSEDLELSRRHARVVRDAAGQLSIEDLGSANGTFLNGEPVRGLQALKVGDSVRVGSTTLEVRDAAASARPRGRADAARRRWHPPRGLPAPVLAEVAREELIREIPSGSVFAGCRVEEVIGYGDMGVVYRAEELALQRPVALKLILPEFTLEEHFRERFRRESRIAAAIDHPNVIPIFDAGEEDGVLFIMMRLVEGTDLRAVIAAEGPSSRSAPRASSARSARRSTPRTLAGCCTATSSPPTCCSPRATTSTSATSGSPSRRPRPAG